MADTAREVLARHANDAVCYLQTTGRRTGLPRTIEVWFGTDGERLYLLSGGRDRAAWVRNLCAQPAVRVRLGGTTLTGRARVIEGEAHEQRARQLLAGKYQRWREGQPLSGWARSALPVEIELG